MLQLEAQSPAAFASDLLAYRAQVLVAPERFELTEPGFHAAEALSWPLGLALACLYVLEHQEEADRGSVAASVTTPPHVLFWLARNGTIDHQGAVAENTSTPPEALRLLVDHPKPRVRRAVAENRATPLGILKHLVEDESHFVREGLVSRGFGITAGTETRVGESQKHKVELVVPDLAQRSTPDTIEEPIQPW